ncbi:peroxiredoxin family protein [Mucilaginibacter gynuensis]|uniref:peroxiredoxin family protein n=1 Tax=Mucilaginibacter gynuensis TaxID=1302236 RepID=UPI003CD0A895
MAETSYDLIAKNGDDITFSTEFANGKGPVNIKGSEEAKELEEFNKISNFWGNKNSRLGLEYEQATQKLSNKDSLLEVYRPVFQKNVRDYEKEIIGFISKNKESFTAFYASTSLDPRENEQQLVAYADAIKGKFSDNPFVQKFLKQMAIIKPVSVGQKAPDFTIPGLDEKPINLADYKGKYVMIDFWASWCPPCRKENPNIVKQYAIYHPKGFNILGISLDDKVPAWKNAIEKDKLTWNHASDLSSFNGPVERLYQIESIPSNFIIDPQGVIVAKNITGVLLEDFLKKTFNKPQ